MLQETYFFRKKKVILFLFMLKKHKFLKSAPRIPSTSTYTPCCLPAELVMPQFWHPPIGHNKVIIISDAPILTSLGVC